jgi:peptidoglycan endopeptidase LytE
MFPRMLAACFLLGLSVVTTAAQTDALRPRQVTTTISADNGQPTLENEPVVVSLAPTDEIPASAPLSTTAPKLHPTRRTHLQEMMLAAIEMRLGTPYRLGTSGPSRYDCSGFVWSVFQSAGISFERASARTLWNSFPAARPEEKLKFGTLVFFNNLNHVGIVADENGFYHASTSKGVVYSPFNEYWSERIVGYRRVPLTEGDLVAVVK